MNIGSTLILAITTTSCSWLHNTPDRWEVTKHSESGKPVQPRAESELVFTLIQQIYADSLNTPDSSLLVIEETLPVSKKKSMAFPQDQAAIHRYLRDVNKICVTNFIKANKTRYKIDASGVPEVKLHTVSLNRINQLFHGGGWPSVQKIFPHAKTLISTSRAGTCADQSEALFYLISTTPDGGGEGILVHGKITGENWTIVEKAVISQADGT